MFSKDNLGDGNGVFSYSDYLEAWNYLDSLDEQPVKIRATRSARHDMKISEQYIEKHDLLLENTAIDSLTRYGIYMDLVGDGLGLYDGVAVYKYDNAPSQDTCRAIVHGDAGTQVTVNG